MIYPVYIYKLTDPRTNEICYIGATRNLPRRLAGHMREFKKKGEQERKKNLWIKKIVELGLSISINSLEECDSITWKEREAWWIEEGHRLGWPLTNTRPGGAGCIEKSEEARKKIGDAQKG